MPPIVIQIEKCVRCDKSVYANEKLEYDHRIYHSDCFKCQECKRVLTAKDVAQIQGQIYCKTCFKKTFLREGKYTSFQTIKNPVDINNNNTNTLNQSELSLSTPTTLTTSNSSSALFNNANNNINNNNESKDMNEITDPTVIRATNGIPRKSSTIADRLAAFELSSQRSQTLPVSTYNNNGSSNKTTPNKQQVTNNNNDNNNITAAQTLPSNINLTTASPLIHAIYNGDNDTIYKLITEHGVHVLLEQDNNNDNKTPVEYAFTSCGVDGIKCGRAMLQAIKQELQNSNTRISELTSSTVLPSNVTAETITSSAIVLPSNSTPEQVTTTEQQALPIDDVSTLEQQLNNTALDNQSDLQTSATEEERVNEYDDGPAATQQITAQFEL